MKVLVFGSKGWIGMQCVPLIKESGHEVVESTVRADDIEGIEELIKIYSPTHILSLIGRTHGDGYSTIDYLELPGKLKENVNDNLFAPLVLLQICKKHDIHYTYMGTGCIFSGFDKQYDEDDIPDFFGSSYSTVKGYTDRLMHFDADKVLNVRIRMPITNIDNPRNFISKICRYNKVCSVPNSMSVLPTLLPLLVTMMNDKRTGTVNLTNPGCISHNDILSMYRTYVDPTFTWRNFTLEEQNTILLSQRSNNVLATIKLEEWFPDVPNINDAVKECLTNWVPEELMMNGHDSVLITGGCGAIGSVVTNYLVAKYKKTKFVNIDDLTYCGNASNIKEVSNYKLAKGNICSYDFVLHIMRTENPTLMIHLAAETHVDQSFTNSFKFTQTNVVGTHTLLEAAREYGKFTRILHMSTDEVYGSIEDGSFHESSVCSPSNPYAASKAAAEMLCHSYIKSYSLPIIIMRCNNAISKYQNDEKLIPKCIESIMNVERIPIHGSGTSKRTFIDALDIASAIECIARHGEIDNVYNIGTDMEYTVLDVVKIILEIMRPGENIQDWVKYVDDRLFQDHRYCIDITKLSNLGWKKRINFIDSVKDVIEHVTSKTRY